MIERIWIIFAALAGAAGVGGDVAVRHLAVGSPDRINDGLVAARFGLTHALALLAVALLSQRAGAMGRWLGAAGWCFVGGELLFCGSLYLLAAGAPPWPGRFTFAGLILLIAGWGALLLHGLLLRRPAADSPQPP